MSIDPRAMEPGRAYPTDDGTKPAHQKPSVGRIVHVPAGVDGSECWPALITAVDGENVWLTAFPPGHGPHPIGPGDDGRDGPLVWHWPERA